MKVYPISPLLAEKCSGIRLLAYVALVDKSDIIKADRAYQTGDVTVYERIVQAALPSPPTQEEVNACAEAFRGYSQCV